MDRYEEVTLKRKENKSGRAKISVLATNEGIHEARANKRHARDLHMYIKEIHTHMRETELEEE
jgi:hypothetical protein